jgi:hypothetical protein
MQSLPITTDVLGKRKYQIVENITTTMGLMFDGV